VRPLLSDALGCVILVSKEDMPTGQSHTPMS
jgi:hypothetical protein